MNYPRNDIGVMHRRTQWLQADESCGKSYHCGVKTNLEWLEAEGERLIQKGYVVEIKKDEKGLVALFSNQPFTSISGRIVD